MILFDKKNLIYLRVQKGLSQEQLALKLGYTRSQYKHYEYTKDHDAAFLLKVSQFFGVPINDFLTKDLSAIDHELLKHKIESLQLGSGLKILTVTINDKQKENIEFVPVKAKAGYLTGYADPEFMVKLRKFSFPLPTVGTFRAFEIEGDSMPPHRKGSIIIGKYVETLQDVKNGRTYIVVTKDEGVVYKRLYHLPDAPGRLILISDNKAYVPYTKHAEDIIELWEYYCHIGFEPNEGIVHLMDDRLVAKVEKLSEDVTSLGDLLKKKDHLKL